MSPLFFLPNLHSRMLVANLLLVLIPVAGVEFARTYEKQLLQSLERDMSNQAELLAQTARHHAFDNILDIDALAKSTRDAARFTRTRIRILDSHGALLVDSHADGAPEGPEDLPPSLIPSVASRTPSSRAQESAEGAWPALPERQEVRLALAGNPASMTRIRERSPSVLLFVARPIRRVGSHSLRRVVSGQSVAALPVSPAPPVLGVVYVTRSTAPVMMELYRIRTTLFLLLAVALVLSTAVTIFLTLSIARPLTRLSDVARRIAAGETVPVPQRGPSEVRTLATALDVLVKTLHERYRYIRDFAADVAHEFKTPISTIAASAEILSEDGVAPSDRDRFLRIIVTDAERLDRLVSRLLDLSRIDASDEPFVDVDIDAIIARVADRFRATDLPVDVTGRAGNLQVRAVDIERSLVNLVDNAARYAPAQTVIKIDVEADSDSDVVRIAVSDSGPGVPIEVRDKLFTRFFTHSTSERHEGTGLGLAIVRSTALTHGGRAFLKDTPSGATFVIELPRQRRH